MRNHLRQDVIHVDGQTLNGGDEHLAGLAGDRRGAGLDSNRRADAHVPVLGPHVERLEQCHHVAMAGRISEADFGGPRVYREVVDGTVGLEAGER